MELALISCQEHPTEVGFLLTREFAPKSTFSFKVHIKVTVQGSEIKTWVLSEVTVI